MKFDKIIKKINKDGYVVLPDMISSNFCEKLKIILNKDYEKYSKKYFKSTKKCFNDSFF